MTKIVCEGIQADDITCLQLKSLNERQDDLQTQVFIVAGVLGGVLLIVSFLIILIFYKINNSKKKIDSLNIRFPSRADELSKRGYSTYTAGPTTSTSALYTDYPSISPNENNLRRITSMNSSSARRSPTLAYDNVLVDSSGRSNAGGVRVLPKDPPPSRNANYF